MPSDHSWFLYSFCVVSVLVISLSNQFVVIIA